MVDLSFLPFSAEQSRQCSSAECEAMCVSAQFEEVVRMLSKSHPKVAEMLEDTRPAVIAFAEFSAKHWRRI